MNINEQLLQAIHIIEIAERQLPGSLKRSRMLHKAVCNLHESKANILKEIDLRAKETQIQTIQRIHHDNQIRYDMTKTGVSYEFIKP